MLFKELECLGGVTAHSSYRESAFSIVFAIFIISSLCAQKSSFDLYLPGVNGPAISAALAMHRNSFAAQREIIAYVPDSYICYKHASTQFADQEDAKRGIKGHLGGGRGWRALSGRRIGEYS